MTAEKCTVCTAYAKDGICLTCREPCDDCECTELYRDKNRKPPAKTKADKAPAPQPAAGIGRDFDGEGRLIVRASHRNPVDIADEVAEHILASNEPPWLFSMSPAAVLLRDGALVPVDDPGWLLYVARRVTFTVPIRDGSSRIIAPPAAVMKLIPPVVIPELPPLDGIATTPYLDRNGDLIAADGYHPDTRRILHTGGLRLPAIPAAPSDEEVSAAIKLLSEEWLGDFPFASPADKANAIAIPLTLTGRMFYALVPLFVLDASTSGSGKGLLAKTTSIIVTGNVPEVMQLPEAGEEQRKKITSTLLAGQELIMWDESHVIAGHTLAAILTAERYSDRLLGGNKMMSAVNRFTMIALGNNVQVRGDMKRRVWPCRLVPDTAHPEHRTGFRHPDLDGWVREHRGDLLGAVLVIWRNWIAKGRPEASITLGSFERWGRAVGGALEAAGITGFGANIADWLSYSEDDDGGWTEHLAQLRRRFGGGWFTVSDVADAVGAMLLKRPPVKHDPDKELTVQLAYAYRGQREKWHGDLRLVRSAERDGETGSYTWTVRQRTNQQRPSDVQNVQYLQSEDGTSGQSPVAEHPEDTEHEYPAPDAWGTWEEGTIGAEAQR